jgi:methyl-accepting chemotaxis protein
VRKLAERSQIASGEITGLSEHTVQVSRHAGEIIAAIVPDIRKTAELVQEIASASREQSAGVGQIGKAMIQLDTVIQQNASASEEMAAMAEELSGQSQQLSTAMAFFKLEEGAKASPSTKGPKVVKALSAAAKTTSPKPTTRPTAIAPADKETDSEFESF